MANARTTIEWTDATWNPTTGCDKVSPGCKHCYAERITERFPQAFPQGFRFTLHPERLREPYRWRKPRRVFVNSMSDLFHERMPISFLLEVFRVMRETPWHTYQILTKRHQRLLELDPLIDWPENVWMGVSVENQEYAHRVDFLRQTGARVKFVSCEPLLGPLELDLRGIHWVIVGGESGPDHRPVDPAWVRSVRDQCQRAGVPFFFKQWGGRTPKSGGRLLDGRTWDEFPQIGSRR
jgi:protein gp37